MGEPVYAFAWMGIISSYQKVEVPDVTYENVIKRGWFCNCLRRLSQKTKHDTWDGWQLCCKCRLPIKGSNHGADENRTHM